MTLFWDRQNKPIEDTIEWAKKFEDLTYRLVAVDVDNPGAPMVSTIWNGMDQAFDPFGTDETALIFETAYIVDGELRDKFASHSEEGALEMHRMVCLELLGREPRPEDGHVQTIIDREAKEKQ
jgi:hypothetical protein